MQTRPSEEAGFIRRRTLILAPLIAIALAGAVALVLWAWPVRVVIIVDNGTDRDLVVSAGACEARELHVRAGSFGTLEAPTGKLRLTAVDDGGREVATAQFDAERRTLFSGERYGWNVGGIQKYAVYTASYGKPMFSWVPDDSLKPERWFPARDVFGLGDYPFLEPFPESITVKHKSFMGPATGRQRHIFHYPPHTDRPCCQPPSSADKTSPSPP